MVLLALYFPYSKRSVAESLRETLPSTLTVEHFRPVYFPHPGCIAEGLTFRSKSSGPNSPPLVTVRKMTVLGSYADLVLRPHHIARIVLEGLRIRIPRLSRGAFSGGSSKEKITIGEVFANGAALEFARADGQAPLRFDVHALALESVGAKEALSYHLDMQNPEPPGEIRSEGHFGPFNSQSPSRTPLSGTYSFDRANLSTLHGIAGILASHGTFSGSVAHINVEGATDVPDFEVTRSHRAGPLATHFQLSVDGTNGNVALNQVNATYAQTEIDVRGSVANMEDYRGKFTALDFAVAQGRIEDMLRLFVSEKSSPMSGVASFRAHVTVPPEGKPFLEEVTLDGDFGIAGGHFEKPTTQAKADKLSAAARGDKKARQEQQKNANTPLENVITDLRGRVALRNGVATFTNLSFKVPGADARLHGTYNLLNEAVNFHGTLKMDAKFSKSASGIKSIFAKIIDPFVDKKSGAVVPVVMNGTYEHPHFGLDLNPVK
ncbi:MAG: AsmA-like C-terminal region-containing protein [Candidatus Sulfotelmatobacter sp.]